MADKIATWQRAHLAQPHHAPRGMRPREACSSAYKTSHTPLISGVRSSGIELCRLSFRQKIGVWGPSVGVFG